NPQYSTFPNAPATGVNAHATPLSQRPCTERDPFKHAAPLDRDDCARPRQREIAQALAAVESSTRDTGLPREWFVSRLEWRSRAGRLSRRFRQGRRESVQ